MIADIKKILSNNFNAISLKQMDHAKLMDRTDTKFSFHISHLAEILETLSQDYDVLTVEENFICKYETLYFDTNNLDLYMKHQNGKLNRYKIRHRTYVESNLGFLEVKFKNNKGRTIKNRIKKQEVPNEFDASCISFLKTKLPFEPQDLHPIIWVNYSRITLVSKNKPERVTLDLNMDFVSDTNKSELHPLVIAEVKQDKKKISTFINRMKALHIREGSISKYCMAIAFLNPVRTNTFKEKLSTIHKILNHDITTSISR